MMSEHGEISAIVVKESKLRGVDDSDVVGGVEGIVVKRVIVLVVGHAEEEEDQEQEFDRNEKNKKKLKSWSTGRASVLERNQMRESAF